MRNLQVDLSVPQKKKDVPGLQTVEDQNILYLFQDRLDIKSAILTPGTGKSARKPNVDRKIQIYIKLVSKITLTSVRISADRSPIQKNCCTVAATEEYQH